MKLKEIAIITLVFILFALFIFGMYYKVRHQQEVRSRIEQIQCPGAKMVDSFKLDDEYGDPSMHVVCMDSSGKFTVK